MAFPAYGLEVPTLAEYEAAFRGWVFGKGTNFEMQEIEGADLPAVRNGDAGRPRDHGRFVGLDVMDGRDITIKGQLHNRTGTFREAWEALANATIPGGSVQEPLYMNFPGFGTLATLVRVRRRAMPQNIQFALGNLADVTLQFAASDPRWYTKTEQTTVTPPVLTNGFTFNLGFNLAFGGGSVAGAASITNGGNIEMRPILIVEGPCTNPSITNANTGQNLTFELTIEAGGKLEIETDLHTATLFTAGSTVGATRLYTLKQGSSWFTLSPGTTTLQFLPASSEGSLTVQWASAYII